MGLVSGDKFIENRAQMELGRKVLRPQKRTNPYSHGSY